MEPVRVIQASFNDGCYVLDGVVLGDAAAFTTSEVVVKCFDIGTFSHVFDIKAHTAPITDISGCASIPNLIFSSQIDTGVAVFDIRRAAPVNFWVEAVSTGSECHSLSVSPSGRTLAVACGREFLIVDTRTWNIVKTVEVHTDDVSRLRFCSENTICTAGEDQLVNLLDLELADDDMVLSVLSCGEVATKMQFSEEFSSIFITGSCENAIIWPVGGAETRIPRKDFQTYCVDFLVLNGEVNLMQGSKDDDGVAGPISLLRFGTGTTTSLHTVHTEVVRLALKAGESSFITGGEDGKIILWKSGPTSRQNSSKEPRLSSSTNVKGIASKPY
jgi:WD40 repeat protein